MRRNYWRFLLALGVLTCSTGARVHNQDQLADAKARTQLQTAKGFLESGQYHEALSDFEQIAKAYPQSSAADDALLAIAQHHVERGGDLERAESAIQAIFENYLTGDTMAMTHIVNGRLKLARAKSLEDILSAINQYERVRRSFPEDEAVPTALYYHGEALQAVQRHPEALVQFSEVLLSHSASIWAARARLGAARSHVSLGDPRQAFRELQNVVDRFPGTPESNTARRWNTILARLYLRQPSPAFGHHGRTVGSKLRQLAALWVDRNDRIVVATETGRRISSVADETIETDRIVADLMTLDPWGRLVTVSDRRVAIDGAAHFLTQIPKERPKRVSKEAEIKPEYHPVDPKAVAVLPTEVLVFDGRRGLVVRFGLSGKYLGELPYTTRVDSLKRDQHGRLIVLDRAAKQILVFDQAMNPIVVISTRGKGYELRDPSDVIHDPLGHLYVLDRDAASVLIFRPGGEFVGAISAADKSEHGFREPSALAIDSAGRLFIHDRKRQQILIYE